MKTHSKFLLAVVFVLGCFASRVAREVVVPQPVQAQTNAGGAASPGVGWQYTCTEGGYDAESMTATLNQWGAQGWELVAVWDRGFSAQYCFKQPL